MTKPAKKPSSDCLTRFKTVPFTMENLNHKRWELERIDSGMMAKDASPIYGFCRIEIFEKDGLPVLYVWKDLHDKDPNHANEYSLSYLDASLPTALKESRAVAVTIEDGSKLYLFPAKASQLHALFETMDAIRFWGRERPEKESNKRKRNEDGFPFAITSRFAPRNTMAKTQHPQYHATPTTSFYGKQETSAFSPSPAPRPPTHAPPVGADRSLAYSLAQFGSRKPLQKSFPMLQTGKENTSYSSRDASYSTRDTSYSTREGFKNAGQTCYINATLQLLFNLTDFRHRITLLYKRVMSDTTLQRAVQEVYGTTFDATLTFILATVFRSKTSQSVVDPAQLRKCMAKISDQFAADTQEDAHELLVMMLAQIEKELLPVCRILSPDEEMLDPLNALFAGEVAVCLRCRSCGHERVRKELVNGLSLDLPSADAIPNGAITLNNLFKFHFTRKELEYKCEEEQCSGESVVETTRVSKLPKVFLVHVKRYEQRLDGCVIKRREFIRSDEHMDVAKWCTDDAMNEEDTMVKFFGEANRQVGRQVIVLDSDDEDPIVGDSLFSGTKTRTTAPPSSALSSEHQIEEEQLQRALKASLETSTRSKEDDDLERALKMSLAEEEDDVQRAIRESLSAHMTPIPSEIGLDSRLDSQLDSQLDAPFDSQLAFPSSQPASSQLGIADEPMRIPQEVAPKEYNLLAVILHHGESYHHGHYVTDAKFVKNGVVTWKCFNDDSTSVVGGSWEDVCRASPATMKAAYILAYTRR